MDIAHYKSLTLLEVAYKTIKNDIAKNILVQGQKLIIRELSERYGISETPIKQALNRLVSEGLIVSTPRKGMKVQEVKWENIEELFEIRYMIETFFIKKVISHVEKNPRVLDWFQSILNEHENTIRNVADINEYYRNYEIDRKFHHLYIQCSENKRIEQLYNNLGILRYMDYVFGKQEMEEMIKGMEEHKLIYKALEKRDENELRKCIETHIENAKAKTYKVFLKDKMLSE